MLSVLLGGSNAANRGAVISYVSLGKDDYANFILDSDKFSLNEVYACPQVRVEFLRRSRAAEKAVQTARVRRESRDGLA